MAGDTPGGVRSIALYLPQFYPVPENDEWWGPGFTEWTNVARARRLFPGHAQPRLPGELGFYDLRVQATRVDQAALAQEHGVSAFCYWHYWFAGRRMLDRVFNEVCSSGVPDFPFCLAWANTSWVGTWTGEPNREFIEQTYPGEDDHRRHFAALVEAFHDPRYVRVDGRPLFYVYRPHHLPEPERFADLWRRLAEEAGLPGLFLVGQTMPGPRQWSASANGFDAIVPYALIPTVDRHAARRGVLRGGRWSPDWFVSALTSRLPFMPSIYRYRHWSSYIPTVGNGTDLAFPAVIPNWDNTPRLGRKGSVYQGASPELFGAQVTQAAGLVADRAPDHRIIFVKSWNEWAEGNYLEPDRRFGRAFLEAHRDALLPFGPAR